MQKRFLRGQTLIEVLVTALLISIAVFALVRAQNDIAYESFVARQRNEALLLGMQKLESLSYYQMFSNLAGYNAYLDVTAGTSTATPSNTTYTLTWTVSNSTSGGNPAIYYNKNINLLIRWTDPKGILWTIQIFTYIGTIHPSMSGSIM